MVHGEFLERGAVLADCRAPEHLRALAIALRARWDAEHVEPGVERRVRDLGLRAEGGMIRRYAHFDDCRGVEYWRLEDALATPPEDPESVICGAPGTGIGLLAKADESECRWVLTPAGEARLVTASVLSRTGEAHFVVAKKEVA